MSGALFHFFWDTTAWGGAPPAPSPSPAPSQDPGSGGGAGYESNDDYFPANEDYWDAREAYLRSLQQEFALDLPVAAIEPVRSPKSPETAKFGDWKQLPRLRGEYEPAVARVTSATNMRELRAGAHRLRELTDAIRRAESAKLAYDRQVRVTKRKRMIARSKKVLASLMAMQALLSLLARS